MAKAPPTHRLWRGSTSFARVASDTVIAKVRGAAAPGRVAMGTGRAAAVAATAATLERLVDNGYAAAVRPVFAADGPLGGRTMPLGDVLLGVGRPAGAGAPRRAAGATRSVGLVALTVARGTSADDLARHVAALPHVEYAFVPPIRRLFGGRRPSGPGGSGRRRRTAPEQWAHPAVHLAEAEAARGFRDGSTVTVAIVDSGIDDGHPDLAPAIAEYRNFLREKDKDYAGHGTHVAGIVGARPKTAAGVSGVSRARLLALKALPRDPDEFDAAAYYRALRHVIGRAQVLNLSLGGGKDPAEIDVLRDVIASGVVVVAAMGNEYEEGNPVEYPAAMAEVCAVGATDRRDRRAWFSNTGRHIDLVAPGVEILSTTPTYAYDEPDGQRRYDVMDGTSMATPLVAGAAALLLAKRPGLSPAQVVSRLTRAADRVAGAKRGSPSYGAGRLNVRALLT